EEGDPLATLPPLGLTNALNGTLPPLGRVGRLAVGDDEDPGVEAVQVARLVASLSLFEHLDRLQNALAQRGGATSSKDRRFELSRRHEVLCDLDLAANGDDSEFHPQRSL